MTTVHAYAIVGILCHFVTFQICYIGSTASLTPCDVCYTDRYLFACCLPHSVYKTEITAVGDPSRWLRGTSLPVKVYTNFADKQRSPGRYSSLTD
jgi:hypothetical protein